MRARDLGIVIGLGQPGPLNAITDVPGVRVGHQTLVRGDGPLVRGQGPVRTGVTVVVPHDGDPWSDAVFAGCHRLNGNGELTGLEWIREAGLLAGVIGLTNTHSVGVVRDALVRAAVEHHPPGELWWSVPVVGETWDGRLNDVDGQHVTADDALAALDAAQEGPVSEGNVGAGTGMVCHGFKGGIGSASRVIPESAGGWVVGVLVQANHGRRGWLRVDGVAVGEAIPLTAVSSPTRPDIGPTAAGGMRDLGGTPIRGGTPISRPDGAGSIIVVVATNAPLLPHQCERLAQRAALGIGRAGGTGGHTSGDPILAFATGNRELTSQRLEAGSAPAIDGLQMVADRPIDELFGATIEATEEAIINALVAAETMVGRDGVTAYAIPHDRLVAAMAAAGRLRGG